MEQDKAITKLGGLNVRQEESDLENHNLVDVSNLDPYRQPGALVVRRGREILHSLNIYGDAVRQIARINAKRYQVVGRTLFRDAVAITGDQDLSTNLETNFQGFRPLNDTTIWAFVADDENMLKDDGTVTRIWGIDVPPDPKPKVSNQTAKTPGDTITAGTYEIAVTQIRWDLNG